jgi:hypothetical protein
VGHGHVVIELLTGHVTSHTAKHAKPPLSFDPDRWCQAREIRDVGVLVVNTTGTLTYVLLTPKEGRITFRTIIILKYLSLLHIHKT